MGRYGPNRLSDEVEEIIILSVGERALNVRLQTLERKVNRMANELDDLNAAVDKITTAVNGAVTDIQTLAEEIKQLSSNPGGVDPAAVEAAAVKLSALADGLNAAVNPPQ